ncbi:MAG: anaerobic ribonucleoside-triphosphate reductase activating protein [archaeon]
MIIKGFQKTSLVDYPGNIVSTVFVGGCNFSCPFCHNPGLVGNGDSDWIQIPRVLEDLKEHRKFIDGVCVSGGEPTIHGDLPEFLAELKSLGLKVKLDTNGSNPGMLGNLIDRKLVDYVAMDIKSSFDSYPEVVNADVDTKNILRSIDILLKSDVDYEFRTTAVPGLFDMERLQHICKEIVGAKKYFIQQFNPKVKLVDSKYETVEPFSEQRLRGFAHFAGQFVQKCDVRNV